VVSESCYKVLKRNWLNVYRLPHGTSFKLVTLTELFSVLYVLYASCDRMGKLFFFPYIWFVNCETVKNFVSHSAVWKGIWRIFVAVIKYWEENVWNGSSLLENAHVILLQKQFMM
jgi:hypothetical protein